MARHLKILIPHGMQYSYLNLIPLLNKFENNSQFSEICLYHAYEPPKIRGKAMPQTLKDLMDDDEKTIKNFLNNQAEIMSKLLKSDTKIKTSVRKNRPVQGIKVKIKKYKPDILMMTTQNHMGISKFINSSNALKLLNQIDIPILILPQDYKFKKDIRLNFLIQHFENYELAKELSKGFKDIFDDIRFIHRDPDKKKKTTKDIKVVSSIEDYIKKSKNDEVFMLIRKKKGKLQSALSKGFVDRLLGLNQAPVIIVNQ
ncbi:universal stress protein [Portibacter lacus]|uniref:UspA domain-containing protein n=1 Tax=Portibacter lacus TaxID=1099794 RepID=A0AA37WCZ6_9BACT|nr:universal stress protein [Portibacter lacus]GLR15419.1 hypothetical protein GCM10007940_00340 [Portibacter lacus]